ncbi:MAG: type II toxin-antitoxin system Phd/YefM family antitoxin [Chloroflexota bacterium]|nr:type II toxin-antitoxin system Phd/YefM family antitoxin [Chloroflexota bacterium]
MSTIVTYSEARQNLASLLNKALNEGEVLIKRRDGQVFVLRPVEQKSSPLDVEGIDLGVSTEEIVAFIAESRRYSEN